MRLAEVQADLCQTQGRLFEIAASKGFDCDTFVKFCMNSKTAERFGSLFDHLQLAGTAYIMEELDDESGGLPKAEYGYDAEAVFWIGYLYEYWHLYTGESHKEIYSYADVRKLAALYPGYRTIDESLAIDRLRGINQD